MAKKALLDQEEATKDLDTDTDEDTDDGTDEESNEDSKKKSKKADDSKEDDADEEDDNDEDDSEETETDAEKIARLEKANNKYQRKLQAAREGRKSSKSTDDATRSSAPSAFEMDERILLAGGMSKELLKQLKDVARLRGTGLIEAQSDPLFAGIKDQYEKDKKQKAASLPAAKGGGGSKVKKTLSTPGLTKEEHKRLTEEALTS